MTAKAKTPSPITPLIPSPAHPICHPTIGEHVHTPPLRPTLRHLPEAYWPCRWTWTSQHNRDHYIDYPYNCKFGQAKKQKFYVVALGEHSRFFLTWAKAKWLVNEFSGAKYKALKSIDLAKLYVEIELALLPPLPLATHRVNYDYQWVDKQGHRVFEFQCCLEIFYTNGKYIDLY